MLPALLGMAACTASFHEMGSSEQAPYYKVFGAPTVGRWLCLSVEPGVPVNQSGLGGPLLGYTRDVVAFYGVQSGQYIEIVHYTGVLGWIDGTKVRPYQPPRPGMRCTVPGTDLNGRPVFEIH